MCLCLPLGLEYGKWGSAGQLGSRYGVRGIKVHSVVALLKRLAEGTVEHRPGGNEFARIHTHTQTQTQTHRHTKQE